MSSVEIIGFAPSTYVRAARMVCEEKVIPYELKASPPHSPEPGGARADRARLRGDRHIRAGGHGREYVNCVCLGLVIAC